MRRSSCRGTMAGRRLSRSRPMRPSTIVEARTRVSRKTSCRRSPSPLDPGRSSRSPSRNWSSMVEQASTATTGWSSSSRKRIARERSHTPAPEILNPSYPTRTTWLRRSSDLGASMGRSLWSSRTAMARARAGWLRSPARPAVPMIASYLMARYGSVLLHRRSPSGTSL